VSLISSGNRSHEALVTYPVLVCPLVSPSYERDRVTDVALIAELSTAALWQRKACAAEGLTPIITRRQAWLHMTIHLAPGRVNDDDVRHFR